MEYTRKGLRTHFSFSLGFTLVSTRIGPDREMCQRSIKHLRSKLEYRQNGLRTYDTISFSYHFI